MRTALGPMGSALGALPVLISLVLASVGGLGCRPRYQMTDEEIRGHADRYPASGWYLNVSLGYEVAKAAEEAAKGVLAGGVTDESKAKAIEAGMQAGLKKAEEEGKAPTDADKADLRKKLEERINKLQNDR